MSPVHSSTYFYFLKISTNMHHFTPSVHTHYPLIVCIQRLEMSLHCCLDGLSCRTTWITNKIKLIGSKLATKKIHEAHFVAGFVAVITAL